MPKHPKLQGAKKGTSKKAWTSEPSSPWKYLDSRRETRAEKHMEKHGEITNSWQISWNKAIALLLMGPWNPVNSPVEVGGFSHYL